MALTQYCEFDEVRAALGVNNLELPDTVLSLPIYEMGLSRELAKISASLPAAFSTASDSSPEARTSEQQALFDSVRLFSAYAVAKQVGVSLAAMVPKDVSDGKASVSRFSDAPYRDVLARVEAMYAGCRADVAAAYDDLAGATRTSSTTPAAIFRGARRTYDPVTG